jgi:hypothetical protein
MAIVAPLTNKAAARPIRADLVMIFSKPICPGERTTHWHWLFPEVCNVSMKPGAGRTSALVFRSRRRKGRRLEGQRRSLTWIKCVDLQKCYSVKLGEALPWCCTLLLCRIAVRVGCRAWRGFAHFHNSPGFPFPLLSLFDRAMVSRG